MFSALCPARLWADSGAAGVFKVVRHPPRRYWIMKASEVVGRTVVTREGGQELGKVKDIVVDEPGQKILGLVVSEGLLTGARVAPWSALQAIGPDSVILSTKESVVKPSEVPEIQRVLD